MEKKRRSKRPGKSFNDSSYANPKRKYIDKLINRYGMNEAVAMEIAYGIISLDSWLRRSKYHSGIAQILKEKLSNFADTTLLQSRTSIMILKHYYQNGNCVYKQDQELNELVQKYEISKLIARKVLDGKIDINEYLDQEQLRRQRKQKTLAIHRNYPEIALNICYQIVDDKISIEEYLKRHNLRKQRREEWYGNFLKKHEDKNRLFSDYLQKLRNKKTKILMSFFEKVSQTGTIISYGPYNIKIKTSAEIRNFHKLELKYLCRVDYGEKLLSSVMVDNHLQKNPIMPSVNPEERYMIPEELLQEGKAIRLTLGGGEIFQGIISWFSPYEIKLLVNQKPKASVVIFQHAIIKAEPGNYPC